MSSYKENEEKFITEAKARFKMGIPTQKELVDYCIENCSFYGIEVERSIRIAECEVQFSIHIM